MPEGLLLVTHKVIDRHMMVTERGRSNLRAAQGAPSGLLSAGSKNVRLHQQLIGERMGVVQDGGQGSP